jgi:hypothetical protein
MQGNSLGRFAIQEACHMAFEYESVKKLLEIFNRSRIIYITPWSGTGASRQFQLFAWGCALETIIIMELNDAC